MRTALITGISGQDGAYLAEHLLSLGYRVVGTSRDAETGRFDGLRRLGIRDRVEVVSMSPVDFRSTLQALAQAQPDEVYILAGQSSVSMSFGQPVETFESIVVGVINLLEAIRILKAPIRLYNAGSSEMFGSRPIQLRCRRQGAHHRGGRGDLRRSARGAAAYPQVSSSRFSPLTSKAPGTCQPSSCQPSASGCVANDCPLTARVTLCVGAAG